MSRRKQKDFPIEKSFNMLMLGAPTYTFLKHLPTDKLVEDLALLYTRLIDLDVEYRNGQVYLADLDEPRVDNPP